MKAGPGSERITIRILIPLILGIGVVLVPSFSVVHAGVCLLVGGLLVGYFYFFLTRVEHELAEKTSKLQEEIGERRRAETALREMHAQLERRVEKRTAELERANSELNMEIAVREKAQRDLEATHARLAETSRLAGMAEVATSVLHNVGNVLNSINVSAAVVGDRVRSSRTVGLAKAVALIHEHDRDLAAFLTSDARGMRLPGYLKEVAVHLAEERAAILSELESLTKNMEHIKEIVTMQQDYGRSAGAVESVPVESLVEDALRLNQGALVRHEVEVARDFPELVPIQVNRNMVLQILVNLIRNAKYALDESRRADKLLTLRTSDADESSIAIAVIDNGVGIAPEHLPRIFEYGFTTRKEGHGFGLHSAVLAAKELGGSLTVQSDGRGKGATFVLTLPRRPEVGPHDDCRA